jgi:hypothetical protein
MKMGTGFCRTLACLGLALAAPVALAQPPQEDETQGEPLDLFDGDMDETDTGWSQFTVSLGYMWLEADGRYDIQGSNGNQVTLIDLDRLGVDDEDGSLWASLKWRSRSSRWGAWFSYWSFSGAGFRIWEDELVLDDDVVVPVGAAVATNISTDWYILEASYSFVQNDHWDAGIGFGFHVVDLETTLAVGARVGDEQRVESVINVDTLAPLPNVLAYGQFRFSERWHLTARAGWFGLSYDDYDGRMINLHALLRYDFSERWAGELGYQFVELDVDVDEGSFTSIYDLDFAGPMALLRFSF